uniref:Uncharacterized protein n=1 Tax=Alexandrium catenella TaxID=2925 RepID=A0A7S1RV41_ALECA|mmetsp:Transcript_74306/g.197401  ORF Transcript_74306/g.197401 Transcript_74306/m.197401 type:complete len:131 (+) Transcript_74306:2-394(+)
MQGMYHQGCCRGPGIGKKMAYQAQPMEGEVVCVDNSMRPRECMVYLRQVELDERMYVVGLWARIPSNAEAASLFGESAGWQARPEDRRLLAFLCLSESMDRLSQLMASHFWFSAPMRRQTAEAAGGEAAT